MADIANSSNVEEARCRCLRSKEMYIHVEPDLSVPSSYSGVFWCIHTQNCLGPDGRVADQESCKPGRACFEPV